MKIPRVGIFVGYSLLGQALAVASLPLLTRFLGPNSFGQLQIWLAWVSLGAAVAHFRLDLRLQQVQEVEAADATLWQSALLSVASSSVFAVAASIAVWQELKLHFLSATFFAIWGSALAAVSLARLLRGRTRHRVGVVNAQSTGGTVLFQTLGASFAGLSGGVIGTTIGRVFAACLAFWWVHPRWTLGAASTKSLPGLAKSQMPYVITTLLAQASLSAPLVVYPITMAAEEFGVFSAAWRVSALPMAVLGVALGHYWIASASRALRDAAPGVLQALFRRQLAASVGIGLLLVVPSMIGVGAFAERIFGEEWAGTQPYLYLLIPVAFSQIVVGPLGQTLLLLQRVREGAVLDAARLIVLVLVVSVSLVFELSPLVLTGLTSVAVFMHYTILLAYVYRALRSWGA